MPEEVRMIGQTCVRENACMGVLQANPPSGQRDSTRSSWCVLQRRRISAVDNEQASSDNAPETGKVRQPPSNRMTIYVKKDRDRVCKCKELPNTYRTAKRPVTTGPEHASWARLGCFAGVVLAMVETDHLSRKSTSGENNQSQDDSVTTDRRRRPASVSS